MVGRSGATRADLIRIFDGGSAAALGDGELLGRFADGGDGAAFEALVGRLGPMVLGVCRRILADPADVDDAFQATFLVLVRRAGSIRDRDLVGAWLHGVAARVARRARADSARRVARERAAAVPEAREGGEPGRLELRALIDEEIGRLPEHHRRPVLLCDVEGLGREEAARRLGWTPNMVRGRLERARDRLRARLARRGVAPSGAWMAPLLAPPTPPPALVATTGRAALAFAAGRIGPGPATAPAVALSRGVLRMMMLSNLKAAAAAAISAGLVAGSGVLATQGPGGGAPPESPKSAVEAGPAGPRSVAELAKDRADAARRRLEAQKAFYEEGRITIDRYLDASRQVMEAERDVSDSQAGRLAALKAHVDRLGRILIREREQFAAGRSQAASLAEIEGELAQAHLALGRDPTGRADDASARAGLIKAARERLAAQKAFHEQGRVTIDRYLDASRQVMEAECAAAGSQAVGADALRAHIDRLKQILSREEDELKAGRATIADVLEVRSDLATAEFALASGPSPARGPDRRAAPASPARSPLAEAVAAFNERSQGREVGRDQPPLTEDEVVAAVRFWDRPEGSPVSDALLARFKAIAEGRRLPPGAEWDVETAMDRGGDALFEGWWVRIRLPKEDGGSYAFPIRERILRVVPLEEALRKNEEGLRRLSGQVFSGRGRMEESLRDLKARIGRRDGAARP